MERQTQRFEISGGGGGRIWEDNGREEKGKTFDE